MWTRYLTTAPVGVAITVALLYSMQALIASGEEGYVAERDLPDITLYRVQQDSETRQSDTKIERLPPPATPPELTPPVEKAGSGEINIPVGPPAVDTSGRTVPTAPVLTDGPLIAIVRVAPEYPARLSSRGIEGFATVRFDVRADGSVSNVRLVEASHPAFARPAMRAAERFRYKPRVVDGVGVPTSGLVFRFRFDME